MYGITQLINQINRETSDSKSLLDQIICNNKDKISQWGVLPVGLSDHYVTYCNRKVVKECLNKHNTFRIRSMKTYSSDNYNEKLAYIDWSSYIIYEPLTMHGLSLDNYHSR